jgi:hypothetical protein
VKRYLTAPLLFSPWAHRLDSRAQTFSAQERLVGGCIAGLIIGVISAMVFMLTSLLFSARLALLVALISALVIDLMAAQSRRLRPLQEPTLTPLSALALGVMLMAKVELLSDIDPEWIGVILICSAGWARSATLTARAEPFLDCRPAPAMTRVFGLLIGAAPLLLFALWPEPVWGLWVAAAVSLWCARLLAPRTWAAPITVRWMASEMVYCLCVLALMSAAAVAEISIEETPGS